ncbi:MAG TPA: MDR family MFS transporter [Casimicrobiaceae bacterium]|nr:MDR family MFS transporter [Casimicrobiaceae bacterium]
MNERAGQTTEAPVRAPSRRPVVLGCVMLALFMAAVEVTIVATALPAIVGKLGGFALYTWVFSGFLLTQASTILVFGKLADLYGRRPVLIAGIAVFLVGSTLCGLAWSMPALIAFRLLQGLGAGSIQPVATTIVGDLYTPKERPRVQGWLSSVWGFAAIVGPLAGGLIVEALSWHWIFWINVPVGLLTITGLSLFLREDVVHHKHRIDYAGILLFCIAIASLLVAVMQGGVAWPWASMQTLVLVVLFVAALALYLRRESRAPEPMVDLALWRSRLVASVNATSLLAGSAIIGVTSFVPMYVQGVLGRSAIVAGFALTAMSVGWPLASMLSGRFLRALDARATVRVGGAVLFAGSLALCSMPRAFGPIGIGASAFLMGFGMGLLNTTFIILIQGSVPWAKRGSATASNIFSRILGSTFGAAALGAVLNGSLYRAFAQTGGAAAGLETIRRMFNGGATLPLADEQRASIANALSYALSHVFLTLAIVGAITMVMTWLVPRRAVFKPAGETAPP